MIWPPEGSRRWVDACANMPFDVLAQCWAPAGTHPAHSMYTYMRHWVDTMSKHLIVVIRCSFFAYVQRVLTCYPHAPQWENSHATRIYLSIIIICFVLLIINWAFPKDPTDWLLVALVYKKKRTYCCLGLNCTYFCNIIRRQRLLPCSLDTMRPMVSVFVYLNILLFAENSANRVFYLK